VKLCTDIDSVNSLVIKFRTSLDKIFSKKQDYKDLNKYYNHLIDYQVSYIHTECLNFLQSDEQKENKRRSSRNFKVNLEKFETKKKKENDANELSKDF